MFFYLKYSYKKLEFVKVLWKKVKLRETLFLRKGLPYFNNGHYVETLSIKHVIIHLDDFAKSPWTYIEFLFQNFFS